MLLAAPLETIFQRLGETGDAVMETLHDFCATSSFAASLAQKNTAAPLSSRTCRTRCAEVGGRDVPPLLHFERKKGAEKIF